MNALLLLHSIPHFRPFVQTVFAPCPMGKNGRIFGMIGHIETVDLKKKNAKIKTMGILRPPAGRHVPETNRNGGSFNLC